VYLKYLGTEAYITMDIRIVNFVYVETTVSEKKPEYKLYISRKGNNGVIQHNCLEKKREREMTET